MFLLLLLLVHQWSVALFRMMGALCRNIVVANAVGLMFMLLVFLMGGFVITKQNVRPWVVWMYWSSPMQVLLLTTRKCTEMYSFKYWMWAFRVTASQQDHGLWVVTRKGITPQIISSVKCSAKDTGLCT